MDNFKKNIDKLVSKILNEEIEKKVNELSEQVGEWTEIKVDEELHGGQHKLDVAEPKGKLTKADFEKLRGKKHKKEVDEYYFEDEFYDDEEDLGDYEGDEEAEEEAEKLSAKEPTYVGRGLESNKPSKMFGSFSDDHGWYDESDRKYSGDFGFDYDEYEFDEFDNLMDFMGKGKHNQKWFGPNDGKKYFDMYKEKMGGPFRVRTVKDIEESETEEGNAFTDKLRKTKKGEKFNLDGKTYTDTSNIDESKEKWIQKTKMKKGALHKKLGVPEGDKIPQSKLKSLKKDLMKKAEGDKKLSPADSKLLKQVNLALTLKDVKENKNNLRLTEDELIDLIENIVLEEKDKEEKEKDNITKKSPEGLKKTQKVLDANKKENEDYAKEVVEKMKKYVKAGSKGSFEENPESFPENNYQLDDMKEKIKKYHPSQAVEEYIEYFSYPGMTNLVYDEIKPEDEKIEKQIKGHRTNGNAVYDEDGKALGNVVPSEVGERFFKNYKENVYGNEQQKASYKRQSQPVETAGEKTNSGGLKSKKGFDKGKAVLDKLEESKKQKKVIDDLSKMKNLISYNRKTQ